MKILSKFGIDIKFIKFGVVGIINTIFGTSIMFLLYNVAGLGYFFSSFCNYFFGSILSYFLNKYFTFNYKKKDAITIIKFIVNISLCYLIAYGGAKPLIKFILDSTNTKLVDNVAMILGMIVFVVINYYGQRYFVFRIKKNEIALNKN